jgi:hypothetical protein
MVFAQHGVEPWDILSIWVASQERLSCVESVMFIYGLYFRIEVDLNFVFEHTEAFIYVIYSGVVHLTFSILNF